MIEEQLTHQLKALNVPIINTTPYSDVEDAAIDLGGEYDGIHLSIRYDYYSVVKRTSDTTLIFITGTGNLLKELKEALAA